VTSMGFLFNKAYKFDQDLPWDVSRVHTMDGIFSFARNFNGDISSWRTNSLESMDYAFSHAASFNVDISEWQTSKVEFMAYAFKSAHSFDQNLTVWSLDAVTDMEGMFYNAYNFEQKLCWDLQYDVRTSRLFCGSQGALDENCTSTPLLNSVSAGCDGDSSQQQGDDFFAANTGTAGGREAEQSFPEGYEEGTAASVNIMVFNETSGTSEVIQPTTILTISSDANADADADTDADFDTDPLKITAIASGVMALVLMFFLACFVVCKRRKIRRERTTRVFPTSPTTAGSSFHDETSIATMTDVELNPLPEESLPDEGSWTGCSSYSYEGEPSEVVSEMVLTYGGSADSTLKR